MSVMHAGEPYEKAPPDEGEARLLPELVGAVGALSAARTVDQVAAVVPGAARRIAGADGATFVLRRGDECHYVDEDAISPLWKGRRLLISECISGWAMLHRSSVAVSDVYEDDRIRHDDYRPTFVRGLLVVPIRTAEPVGAIGAYWAHPHQPSADETGLLQALADSTAVAIENVNLYASLEDRVAGRAVQRTADNEDLRRFASILAHDVRQPLTTITGYAELLRTRFTEELPTDAYAMLEALQRAARNLANFVMDIQAYATASAMPALFESIAVEDLVRSVFGRLGHEVETRGARVTHEGSPELIGDRALLSQALQNLVSNALNYTPVDRRPEICISVRETTRSLELRVVDNGIGVRPEDRERIFEPFERGQGSTGNPGTGLGLALCRRVAEQHGGTIRVEAAQSGGSAFVIELPRRDSQVGRYAVTRPVR